MPSKNSQVHLQARLCIGSVCLCFYRWMCILCACMYAWVCVFTHRFEVNFGCHSLGVYFLVLSQGLELMEAMLTGWQASQEPTFLALRLLSCLPVCSLFLSDICSRDQIHSFMLTLPPNPAIHFARKIFISLQGKTLTRRQDTKKSSTVAFPLFSLKR